MPDVSLTNEGKTPILQNRNRATPSSIAQMQSIATQPDYGRLGFSRDFANGAPVVAGGQIAPEQLGRQDVAVASDGRRIPVQYAVVEAADVLPSNQADGTPNPDYGNQAVQRIRAIAGNGRIAGLQLAYRKGTTPGYLQELASDTLHGVSPDVIRAMRAPVLVRVMPTDQVTADIGDVSNTTGNLNLSAVEQANNDSQRVNLDALQFAEDGSITPEAVRQFVRAMPQAEQGGLIDTNGQPTKQAVDRINAAVFAKAYGSDELVRLYAQAQDPEARNVLSALAQVAPKMARLEGAGALDIRGVVTQAAEIAVNARREGKALSLAAQQLDLAADPDVGKLLDLFARNARTVKPVVEALSRAADFAYTEANKPGEDMFGEVPRASRADIINQLGPQDERASQETLEDTAGRQPAGQDAGRQTPEPAGPAAPAEAEAGRPAEADRFPSVETVTGLSVGPGGIITPRVIAPGPLLTAPTPEEVTQRIERLEQAEAERKAAEAKAEQDERDANSLGLTTVREDGQDYNAEAPRRPYTDDRQLQLFLDNGPDPSQAGPRGEAAQREAVAAVDDLRSTETILGLALSRDYAARQRVSLVGQKVSSAEDLAVLAQVYRDPRFETFRVVFVNDAGKVVSQVGLTSRLPASTQAVMGSDVEGYLSELSATARNRGATGFYMLHNHPSGLSTPSMADRSLTQTFALSMPSLEFKSHVVIDTNEYSTIDAKGRTETLKKDFGQPAPYRAQEWADVKISGPADVMSIAKRLQVDDGAITLIHTDSQYNVKAISTIPADASTMSKEELKKLVLKASLQKQGAQVFAVGRDSKALTRIGTMVVDAIYVEDSGQTQSLRSMGVIAGGAPLPNDRRTRVSPDTSPEFAYLRRQSQPAPMQRVAEDGPQYDPEPTQSPNRDALGRLKFRLGEVALHKLDALTRPLQERFGMRMASPELRKQLRQMKATIEEAKRAAVNVAKEMSAMTEADRAMVSDIVEKMIAPGVVPPEHAVKVADAITRTMDQQTDELVALGMLSADSADRWRGRYLPRIYNRETELADDPLIKRLFKTGTPTMAGIGGGSLKGRGLFQDVSVDAVDQWLAMGYEVRDPHWRLNQGKLELKDPNAPKVARDMVTVWRDWTPSERAQMGENRDAMYRFVMGYTAMQRDIALGRLFNNIANNPEWVRRSGSEGWVQVPNTEIPDTGGVKRYGNLAGLYVRRDVMSHLTQFEEAANDTLQLYREALGLWKEGKALALDTPIPTPGGWKTMGELQVGDVVFDERGQPCNVTYVTGTQLQRECYELEFSDGTKIVADAEHLWFTIYNGRGEVKNTLRIIETLKERTRGDNKHSIPVAGALQLPEADLPIPPYALGVWLGDGNSNSARITVGSADAAETVELLRSCGIESSDGRKDPRGNVWSYGIRFAKCGPRRCDGLQPTLRSIGVLGNKHIPAAYLRASEAQRRELLCGLMDTDGSVTARGQCEFSTTSKTLFDGMMELLRSLGYKPSHGEQAGSVNGKACSNVWRIKFQAFSDKPVFKLPRKVARLRERPVSRPRSGTRQIVAVRPVESVPVKCITVDSPSRLYLAGDGMVPTHNTALNPVAHFNNVMANVSMAHFAGVSYWDGHKYVNAVRDLVNDAPMVDEARKVGLFTGSFTKEEMVQAMPPELQKLMNQEEGVTRRAGKQVMNALTFWLRKPLRDAYEFEDTFFKYLIYRDARQQGMEPTEAMDYALRYIFTYDDLPSGARKVRDYAIPFFSWTYKAIPALLHTAMVYPWRFLAPAAVLHGINIVAYSLAAGDEDDDWLEKIAKGRELEEEERDVLPKRMQGMGMLANPKSIRLGTDELTGHPIYLDASRVIPGGDMFDMVNQAGGIALPAPLMPNHPVLSAFSAMIVNREMFFGRDITDRNDTSAEAFEKRAKWMAGFLLPAVSPGGYHSQRILDATANAMDTVITTPLGEFTGVDRSGLPVQPKFAAMQTIGIKARPVDLELEEQRRRAQEAALVNSIAAEVRSMARLYQRGAVSDRMMDKTREQAREKIERMREER